MFMTNDGGNYGNCLMLLIIMGYLQKFRRVQDRKLNAFEIDNVRRNKEM